MIPANTQARVKHLNPRQGIKTDRDAHSFALTVLSVKHLNPRQGIKTGRYVLVETPAQTECETPKSPPGD